MFVVHITIEEYPNVPIGRAEPEIPPSRIWNSRTTWPDDNQGYQQGAADVLERAAKHAAEGLPAKKDPRAS